MLPQAPAQAVEGKPVGPPVLARRSFMFRDVESAQQFELRLQAGISDTRSLSAPRSVWDLYEDLPGLALHYGGEMFRSRGGRELRVYGYQQRIHRQDREYLLDRDTTAGMLIEQYDLVWNGIPRTYVPAVDAYFAQQAALGLLTTMQAGYQERYQEGGAFVYLETTGDLMQRLSRGERPVAWTFVPAASVIDDPNDAVNGIEPAGPGNVDPLLDHGLEFVSFWPTAAAHAAGTPLRVHGSRLIPINLDPRSQKWWRERHIRFHRPYDTLWELRDLIFSRVRAGFQADPIVVDVDISEAAQKVLSFDQDETDLTKKSQQVEQAIRDYNTGAKDTFAPVMGYKLRRLGAAQLPDPKEDIMALSSRLSHGSLYPVKFILASTKGSNDVGDQDILMLAGNVRNVRNVWAYKHLSKVLLMGQVMGVGGLRMQEQFNLPHPDDVDWPSVRPLSPRDAAFLEKTDAAVARELQEASLVLPARLRRKFPEDPRYPYPLWLAARGRNTLGENTDTDPKSEPGSAGSGSSKGSARTPDPDYEAWLDGKDAPKKRSEDDEEGDENARKKTPKRQENDSE